MKKIKLLFGFRVECMEYAKREGLLAHEWRQVCRPSDFYSFRNVELVMLGPWNVVHDKLFEEAKKYFTLRGEII